jgi:cytochrome bd-type quinol oxidase subunit 2
MITDDGFFLKLDSRIDAVYTVLNALYVFFYLLMIGMVFLFFRQRKNPRSQHYTWGLRMALLLFTGSITLGFVMLYLDSYSIGGMDGSDGIPLFNWSKRHGDLRVVLFMGVHSLQIIPLLSHFLFEKKRQVVFFSMVYLMLMCLALFFTFLGQSFF